MPHPYTLPGFDWLHCDQAGKALANGADPEPYISLVRQLVKDGKVRSRGGPSLSAPGRSPQVERASLIEYCKVQGIPLGKLDPDWTDAPQQLVSAYTTPLLVKLQETIKQFWSTYDSKDTSTAPGTKEIVEWLTKERNCTTRQAKAIDLIIRPEQRRKGGRKPKV